MCADRIGERDATSSALVRLGKRAALCWTGVVRHPSDPRYAGRVFLRYQTNLWMEFGVSQGRFDVISTCTLFLLGSGTWRPSSEQGMIDEEKHVHATVDSI
jgi:hypothetical protein